MIVDIDLENLKLKGLTYDDEVLRYNGYRLELWNSPLIKITESFAMAVELFFQESFVIDTDTLKKFNFDIGNTTIELSNLLFDNIQMAEAIHQYTLAPYNEISEGIVTYDNPIIYKYAGDELEAYYESQVISTAKEFKANYLSEMNLDEIVDEYILDYLDFTDTIKLVDILRDSVSNEADGDYTELLSIDDSIEFIKKYNKQFEDLVVQIEDNDLFDYDKFVDDEIYNIDTAIEEVSPYIGDMVFDKVISIAGWNETKVYIFERY